MPKLLVTYGIQDRQRNAMLMQKSGPCKESFSLIHVHITTLNRNNIVGHDNILRSQTIPHNENKYGPHYFSTHTKISMGYVNCFYRKSTRVIICFCAIFDVK